MELGLYPQAKNTIVNNPNRVIVQHFCNNYTEHCHLMVSSNFKSDVKRKLIHGAFLETKRIDSLVLGCLCSND